MNKQSIFPDGFTKTIGAYSHGMKMELGDSIWVFVTGQIAMDEKGHAVAPDDITAQTEYVFNNIKKILEEADLSIDDVVKAVIYVTDMSQFGEISAVRNKYFGRAKPVSTLVEINKTVKEGCDIEIEVIAVKGN